MRLMECFRLYGSSFGRYLKFFPKRTFDDLAKRFQELDLVKGNPFTMDQDNLLVHLSTDFINDPDEQKWFTLAKTFPGRTASMVFQRFVFLKKSSRSNGYISDKNDTTNQIEGKSKRKRDDEEATKSKFAKFENQLLGDGRRQHTKQEELEKPLFETYDSPGPLELLEEDQKVILRCEDKTSLKSLIKSVDLVYGTNSNVSISPKKQNTVNTLSRFHPVVPPFDFVIDRTTEMFKKGFSDHVKMWEFDMNVEKLKLN